jgi:hypothetical protein
MADPTNSPPTTGTPKAAPATAAADKSITKDAASPTAATSIETALAALPHHAAADAAAIGPKRPDDAKRPEAAANEPPAGSKPGKSMPLPEQAARSRLPHYATFAASIGFAAVIGALVGAGAITSLQGTVALPIGDGAIAASFAQLQGEIAALRKGIGSAQGRSGAQIGKLTERLDRLEKAQAEPAARLAKITETLERLERHAGLASSDITGSISKPATAPRHEAQADARPPVAEGWRLRDFANGRAVVEDPNGRLFDVRAGSNLPRLGRVESVRRQDGRILVVARNGIITASLEWRRPAFYLPYRF